ncbi:MAG TPA: HlyD family efflux transporter periplasmic adaptor subunit [Allosphingosinicella sp.]|jgi:membrane fusion protein|nr:HlyD family efflux transporter periplasmic adaptor subunit [Allosphingosinicella sp.]
MTVQLFRQEVIEAGRERLAGTVVAATPPQAKVYVGIVLFFAALLAAILTFGQYATRAQVKGIVAFDTGIARVYPSAPAEIRAFHVTNGQHVEPGTPLVTLAIAQGEGGLTTQLNQLAGQDQELARQQELAASLGTTEIGALDKQKASIAADIASLDRQRTFAESQLRLAESATGRSARLAAQGAGTQRQVEDSRSQLLARRAEAEQLGERLIAQRQALAQTEAQIAQKRIEAERSGADIAAQRAALGQQRTALSREGAITLVAPIAGDVSDISAEVGQRAKPDASLVTIVPSGSHLEIWLYAPTRAVGFVHPGQEVRLLFDAFPYQKYGAGRGHVIGVSRVPIEPASLDSSLGITEPVFRVRVAINDAVPRLPEAAARLRPGMTLSANLVLERQSLWEVLFNPFRTLVRP